MPVKTPAIEATGLTFVRNGEALFENFSFSIKQGSYVAVIGPNGGGKSTLLRVMLGLLEPTAGTVRIFGEPCDTTAARKRVGYVAQRGGLIDPSFPATAEEVVRAGRTQVHGLSDGHGPADTKAVKAAFKATRIEHLRDRVISSLSGGERQRVLLARALAAEPDILMLDEPIEGLDPASREEFYDTLRGLNKAGKTVIFISHDVHRIAKEADSALCLRHELVCHGTKACVVSGKGMRALHHDHVDLSSHHGLESDGPIGDGS
ncbi:MAG TPA: metal ABC transporter ATP-binding protein [Candidatus Eisenbacteria bacterium]|nr:metal ABC transporter ATP-binding protein [Candidatus Eisenbacteria bacterium]